MIFVPLSELDREPNQTFSSFSKQITFGVRSLFYLSVIFMMVNQVLQGNLILANIPTKTFQNHQFWRLFTAPFATLDGMLGLISIVIAFWWIIALMPHYESKFSTSHFILEILFQNFTHQICFSLVTLILTKNQGIIETYNNFIYSIGWFPLIVIWTFKCTAESPQEKVNFCFMPCRVKRKFVGWITGIFFILLSQQRCAIIVALALGTIQFQILKRSIVLPPLCLHKGFEWLVPNFIKNKQTFISINDAKQNLQVFLKIKSLQDSKLKQIEIVKQSESQNMEMKQQNEIQLQYVDNFQAKSQS